MGRVERSIKRRNRRKKISFLLKTMFILIMVIVASICLISIDSSANKMLGNKPYIEDVIYSIKESFNYYVGQAFR